MHLRLLSLAFCFASFSTPSLANCDESAGLKQYNKCIACHSTEAGVQLMGPSLHAIVGRQVGSIEGFVYSDAMANSDDIWSEELLDRFLEKPAEVMPGTVMPFGGIKKPAQREALICYMKTL